MKNASDLKHLARVLSDNPVDHALQAILAAVATLTPEQMGELANAVDDLDEPTGFEGLVKAHHEAEPVFVSAATRVRDPPLEVEDDGFITVHRTGDRHTTIIYKVSPDEAAQAQATVEAFTKAIEEAGLHPVDHQPEAWPDALSGSEDDAGWSVGEIEEENEYAEGLGQRVALAMHMRDRALELAIQSAPGYQHDEVLKRAEAFRKFLAGGE